MEQDRVNSACLTTWSSTQRESWYVTDRDNQQRIQIFDANGKFLREWTGTGGVSGLALLHRDGHIATGSVVRDLKGAVVAKLPDAAPAHGAAVDAAGNIYLAQLTGIVQKVRPAVGFIPPIGDLAD